MKLLFLNGVNLNMTGRREKGVYGTQTLEEINAEIEGILQGTRGRVRVFPEQSRRGAVYQAAHDGRGRSHSECGRIHPLQLRDTRSRVARREH